MTDVPTPPPPPGYGAPQPTVVLDTNAVVKKSHLPVIIAAVLVVAFAAFSVVWFATRDSSDYQPKAEALAVVDGLKNAGITVTFSNGELKCIDETFAGVDLTDLEGAYDPFGGDLSEDTTARTGKMLEDCLGQATRVDMIVGSLAASDLGTADQQRCAAGKFDKIVADHGGYSDVMVNDTDISTETLAAFTECGIDLFGGGDSSMDTTGCEAERLTVDTAIEAYYADNNADATSIDDLVPDLLSEDPSDRFEFVPGTDGAAPTFVGVGECEGY